MIFTTAIFTATVTMATKRKVKLKVDGLSPDDIKKIRSAIRQVWSWSTPKRLCVARCIGADGFSRCEECKKKVPKIFVDHTTPVGEVDAGFIARLFCPSSGLRGMCHKCHRVKTASERKAAKGSRAAKGQKTARRGAQEVIGDF